MNNFYLPSLSEKSELVELQGDEAKHMIGSRRLGPDDKVILFNGTGLVAQGVIDTTSKKSVRIKINRHDQLNPLHPRVVLATALPKGDRLNILLDMATQLGMTDFIPLTCRYSVVTNINSKLNRYKRICINACKQSGRYYLPKIHPAAMPEELIDYFDPEQTELILAEPTAKTQNLYFNPDTKVIVLIVGPEGGFSEQELQLFNRQRLTKTRLSNAILRIETACIVALAKINHRQTC